MKSPSLPFVPRGLYIGGKWRPSVSGKMLHSTNPDAPRHPASLTKIMTLYLLFEQLEAGKLKQMKKYLLRQEQSSKRHKRERSKANYRRANSKNLSHGAKAQFRKQSMGSAQDWS